MKKLMLTLGLLVSVCMWMNAEVTDAQINESKERVEKIKSTKEELAKAKTNVADIDAFKDAVAEASEEVIKSGEKMAELYTAWKNEQNVLPELLDLAVQMKAEVEKVENASKLAEPAGKAVKGIKNPKILLTANKLISNSTSLVTLDTEEIVFQVNIVSEMIKLMSEK